MMQTLLTSREQERGERCGREIEREGGGRRVNMGRVGGAGGWQGMTLIHTEEGEGLS